MFTDTHNHLVELPGFIRLTWCEHPDHTRSSQI